jgi:alkyl hydroperoxide reductase subunit F
MLEDNLKTQLKGYLERLVQPVEIIASLDDGDKSREMLELLQDIVSLSPLVSLASARDAAQVKPSFALRRPGAPGAFRGLAHGP